MSTPQTEANKDGAATGLAVTTGSPLCLSCGRKPAALRNYDGAYCVDCMKVHLLEKMFVQLTKLNR